jgi:hypothetical protein
MMPLFLPLLLRYSFTLVLSHVSFPNKMHTISLLDLGIYSRLQTAEKVAKLFRKESLEVKECKRPTEL